MTLIRKNKNQKYPITALMFYGLFVLNAGFAAVTGRITGTVNDKSTGEPLAGVNIVISESYSGSTTDINGTYLISNLTPGTVTVKVSMIGYAGVTVKNVEVLPEMTTRVDIPMQTEVLEGEEIIVVAEKPLVRKDATTKVTTISREEIASAPLNDLSSILKTQSNIAVLTGTPDAKAGYNVRGIDDVHMRGGRNNEVALMIDGVKVSNPLFGGFGTRLNVNAIEQLTIASGGFNAKYGNALSGVINLTTRDGGSKYSGSFHLFSSAPSGVTFLSNDRGRALNYNMIQATLSGAVPLLKKTYFFVSGEISSKNGSIYKFDNIIWDDYRIQDIDNDGVNDTLPSSEEIIQGYLQYEALDSVYVGLGSKWNDIKGPDDREINPLDSFKGWQSFGWNNGLNIFTKLTTRPIPNMKVSLSVLADQRYRQFNNANAYYLYYMDGQNVQFMKSEKLTLSVNHTLSQNTFYSILFSKFHESRQVRVLKDYQRKFSSYWNVFSPPEGYDKKPDEYYTIYGEGSLRDPFEGTFYMRADNRWYDDEESVNYELKVELAHELNNNISIETGLHYSEMSIDFKSYQNYSDVDPFPTIYIHHPVEAAAYLQSKLEYDFVVINLGLRTDYANSGGAFWDNPLDPLGEQDITDDDLEYNLISDAKSKIKISPRLGMAFPLTDRTILHFNFGHFYQNPNYRDLYRASGDNREISLIQGNIIGNPHLENEKSVQYEFGLQHQVGLDYGIDVVMWQKETSNQIGSVKVPAYQDPGGDNPYSYAVFLNNNSGFARGMDFSVTKRYSNYFSGSMHYSWSESYVLQATSWDGYWSGTTLGKGPRKEVRSPWDQPHTFRMSVTVFTPDNFGPVLFGLRPLSGWNANLFQYMESGRPYTPYIPGNNAVEPMSKRWPMSQRTDMKIIKIAKLKWGKIKYGVEIKNLFDRLNVLTGYTRTGSATDPGTSSWYTSSSTYWDSRNNNNFGMRRSIRFIMDYSW